MTTPPSRNRTPLVIAAVIAAVAVLALVAILATRGGGDDEASSSTVAATPPSAVTGASPGPTAAGPTDPIDPLNAVVDVSGTALAPADPTKDTDPAVGQAAPALSGTNYLGQPVTVTPGSDGPLLLVFVAHWCPHCNREIPVLNQWADDGDVPSDLRIVGISTAVAADRPNFPPGAWLAQLGWRWDVIADGPSPSQNEPPPAIGAYGVTGFPFMVLVDGDGKVVARTSGEHTVSEMNDFVAQLDG